MLFADAVIKDKNMYFFDNLSQCMCEISLFNYNLRVMAEYKEKKNIKIYKIFLVGHKFYLLGSNYGEVLIYDEEKNIFYMVGESREVSSDIKYVLYNNFIFFLPNDISRKLCIFDVNSEQFSYQKSLAEIIGKNGICTRISIYGNVMYCSIKGELFYIKYDLDKMEIISKVYSNDVKDISAINVNDEQIWIADNISSELVCFYNKKIRRIFVEHTISKIIELNDTICVLFRYHNSILFIDKISLEMKTVMFQMKKNEYKRDKGGSNFSDCIEDMFFYYILPWKKLEVLKISKKDYTYETVCFYDNNESMRINNLLEKRDFFEETDVFSLCNYLNVISNYKTN